jgi:hypothetical protein
MPSVTPDREDGMTEQSRMGNESSAGVGVHLNVTQARAGVRRGVSRILVVSTALAVVAVAAVWFVTPRSASMEHATPKPAMTGQAAH